MGQYYFPTILREKNGRYFSEQFYSHDYDNGLKLMEHSYVGNDFTETVLSQLHHKPGRLAWIGDYAEKGDFAELHREDGDAALEALEAAFFRHYKAFGLRKGKKYTHPEAVSDFSASRFILNHDKKVFIDMRKYCEKCPETDWGATIHPLPLLTAVGNGRGGGDYGGELEEDVGCWCGDLIEVQDAKPNGYADVTEDCFFEES